MSRVAPQACVLHDILHCLPPALGAQPNGRSRHAKRSLLVQVQPKLGAQQGHQPMGRLGAAWKEQQRAVRWAWGRRLGVMSGGALPCWQPCYRPGTRTSEHWLPAGEPDLAI